MHSLGQRTPHNKIKRYCELHVVVCMSKIRQACLCLAWPSKIRLAGLINWKTGLGGSIVGSTVQLSGLSPCLVQTELRDLREGTVMAGIVSCLMYNHGVQVDLGAQHDG